MQNNDTKFVLVIDDSEDNQALLTTLLAAKGFRVECASNGEEALTLLQEFATLPDLILLDAQMPVMDGYRFRLEQRKVDRIKDIPVIIMSGDDDIDMAEKMSHPHAILVKPLQVSSLLASVSSCASNLSSSRHHP